MKKINILLLLVFIHTAAFSISIDYKGSIVARYTCNDIRNSYLNPNQEIFELSKYENKLYANIFFNTKLSNTSTLTLKLRPEFLKTEKTEGKRLFIDNAYLTFVLPRNVFLTLGKMNIVESVGYSYRPSSFFLETKQVDYSKKEEEQKTDLEGDYIIYIEKFFDILSFSTIYAPYFKNLQETQKIQTKLSFMFHNFDLSFNYFYSTFSAAGLNFSAIVTESLEIHTEIAAKEKSQKSWLKVSKEVYGQPLYEIQHLDENKISAQCLVGGHYTFSNKMNLIFEYFYNHNGYDKSEWENISKLIEDNYKKYNEPPIGFPIDIFKANLGTLNSLMTYRFLRQNYLFLRYWWPEIKNNIGFTCGILLNIDDKSFIMFPEIEIKVFKNGSVLLGNYSFYGEKLSEFGLIPFKSYSYIETRFYF